VGYSTKLELLGGADRCLVVEDGRSDFGALMTKRGGAQATLEGQPPQHGSRSTGESDGSWRM
jgi:hypothetical protein